MHRLKPRSKYFTGLYFALVVCGGGQGWVRRRLDRFAFYFTDITASRKHQDNLNSRQVWQVNVYWYKRFRIWIDIIIDRINHRKTRLHINYHLEAQTMTMWGLGEKGKAFLLLLSCLNLECKVLKCANSAFPTKLLPAKFLFSFFDDTPA